MPPQVLGQAIDFSWFLENPAIVGYNLLIFAVIIFAGWVVGRAVGAVIGRLTSRFGADSIFRRTAIGRAIAKSDFTASQFFDLLSRWFVYIVAILLALNALGLPFISDQVTAILARMPNYIGAVIIFLVGVVFSDWIGELIRKSFTQEERSVLYVDLGGNLVKLVLYFVTLTIALSEAGVDVTILNTIAQALAWSVAIAVGVAAGIVIGWFVKERFHEITS